MKQPDNNKYILLLLLFSLTLYSYNTSAQEDSVVSEDIVKLRYFNSNNSVHYLLLENFLKTGRKLDPQENKAFKLYLDSSNNENFIARVITDKAGKAKITFPPSLKWVWTQSSSHNFVVISDDKEQKSVAELEITKAKIEIDTISEEGIRSVTVRVIKQENEEWVPANEVEMKVGIRRLGGIISAGEEETYTTDSSGNVTVELRKDTFPGDQDGNIVLVAKVEDNDQHGNLWVEKTVPWGSVVKADNSFFNQRALWSTRSRTPIWLLFMSYSIILGVWGTIIYLVLQIVRIKKLGNSVQ